MKAVLSVLAVTIVGAVGPSRATAGEPDQKKLYARCVDCSALIFGPESTKEPAPLAGAIILDRDKRLVLARSYNVPDAPTAIFPAYTAKGELRNRPTDYPDLWRKGELWKGKVLHRDKWRDVTVIELDRALPDRALPAELAPRSAPPGSIVYALNQLDADWDTVWGLNKGKVRAVAKEAMLGTGTDPSALPTLMVISSTAPPASGPECGLFDETGLLVGFPNGDSHRASLVTIRLDVSEVRAFLTENKVPFKSAPEEPGAKDRKAK